MFIKKILIVVTLLSITSLFAAETTGPLICNHDADATALVDKPVKYTSEELNGLHVVSFGKKFKPKDYFNYYLICAKKFSKAKNLGYSIDGSYLFYDKSTMNEFIQANTLELEEKIEGFLMSSTDGISDYDIFLGDTVRAIETYITTDSITGDTVAKNRINLDKDKTIALYVGGSWSGDTFFSGKNRLPSRAQDAIKAISTQLTNKYNNFPAFNSQLTDALAKFIVITANQSSFDAIINQLISTNQNASVGVFPQYVNRYNFYQIIPSKKSNEVKLAYTQVVDISEFLLPSNPSNPKITFKKPVRLSLSIDFILREGKKGLEAELDTSSGYDPFSITLSGGDALDFQFVQMFVKGGLINSSFTLRKHSVANNKNILFKLP